MKILVDICHPAHVHFYRNPLAIWRERGHELLITAREKDIATQLMDSYGWNYTVLSRVGSGLSGLAKELLVRDFRLWRAARRFKPDVITATPGIYAAQVSRLMRIPSVVFTDTENATLSNRLTFPFATTVCTPTCFEQPLRGENHLQYRGYHELSYTHPAWFTPEPEALTRFGLSKGEPFIFVRLVSWGAVHDVHDAGFSDIVDAVAKLQQFGRVLISSEAELPAELEPHRMSAAPELVHHLLYYARLVIGESATMASEAATFGTPAVFISTSTRGYTNEQGRKYGLVFTYSDRETAQRDGMAKALEILSEDRPREYWQERRSQLLSDKIDVAQFIADIVEQHGQNESITGEKAVNE